MMNKKVRKGNTTRSLDDTRSFKKAVTEPDNNARQNPSSNDTPVSLEIPEPEFNNFDAEKSTEKFQAGQIWAIYSDEDALPLYYGRRFDTLPEITFRIAWLYHCLPTRDTIRWVDKTMQYVVEIHCKKVKNSQTGWHSFLFSCVDSRRTVDRKDVFTILPGEGEIWALYKNWNVGMKLSEMENCDYEIVEIMDVNEEFIVVVPLELVHGYKSVFKPRKEELVVQTVVTLLTEMLKFSHRIPAFPLKEDDQGGIPKCSWELDSAAVRQYKL
ncbi:DNAJ heat shock N-terminal domain-containing protein [Abeliophyllum distichum]|uniref:DNAJ heat shock N-terminal domain-containing protein n=1 Tax=Abeliophyllum distichum TaxID=126358 RepID=A0ABD1VBB4_9LAMI